jgi:hypothetical protein
MRSREGRLWIGGLVALGAFTAFMLVVGNLGQARPGVHPITVAEILAEDDPAARWGGEELFVVGWYAELDGDCEGDDGGADASIAWLQRECPLRVLMPEQPSIDVTQAELEQRGVRLASPPDVRRQPFPSRAQPDGPNLRGQQLVYEGHFDDPRAVSCVPERVERCRRTLVVSDYDQQVR